MLRLPFDPRYLLLTASLALGCPGSDPGSDVDGSVDGGRDEHDGGATRDGGAHDDAGTDDADVPPTDGGPELTAVSHRRELRGVWLTTVYNLDWPSRSSLSASAQREELEAILDLLVATGFNAVFLQVRPEGDALYRSSLEPWSRFLTGTMGRDPGWDPLAVAIEEAHARGLELHAWVNPYRGLASSSTSTAEAEGHPSRRFPQHAHVYGSSLWMDPGAVEVQQHALAVMRELLESYDLDGLVFDDYFYPYPYTPPGSPPGTPSVPFPDDATWTTYQATGGALSRADWRRDNVNRFVAATFELVREVRPTARFGISPFGIYRPGMPAGITGLDAYAAIYADARAWWAAGTVDWLGPQLYWPSTQAPQAYGVLVEWWGAFVTEDDGRFMLAANDATRLGSTAAWTLAEVETQVDLTRAASGMAGNVFFRMRALTENRHGLTDALRERHYAQPALPPATPGAPAPAPPTVSTDGDELVLRAEGARGFGVYDGPSSFAAFVPATDGEARHPADGVYAVTTVGLGVVESAGVRP
ncbi:MAG: family 10 glycosylhydrolase [Myxococcales bacterium]|nr:family 10 glycosylhydrolase [Myxococcales bacterium]